MLYDIFAVVSSFIINIISASGYAGVFFLMALESACIPVPSEIIMPFSGYLVFFKTFSFWPVVIWGTLGNLLGSIAAYFAGFYGGRPLIKKYGKYILITEEELEKADRWFLKYGQISIFFSRMMPIVRTFISLPAGIARMPFLKFCIYTFAGSLPWSFLLTYLGLKMGENWHNLETYFRKFDWLIIILVVVVASWWIYKRIKKQ